MRQRLAPGSAIILTTAVVLTALDRQSDHLPCSGAGNHATPLAGQLIVGADSHGRVVIVTHSYTVPRPTTALVGPCSCAGNRYNCPNLATQRWAQASAASWLVQVRDDIYRLDGDHDGVACESLPQAAL